MKFITRKILDDLANETCDVKLMLSLLLNPKENWSIRK